MVDVSLGNHKPQAPPFICAFIKDSHIMFQNLRIDSLQCPRRIFCFCSLFFRSLSLSLSLFLKWSLEVSNGHIIDLQMRCDGRWVTYSSGEGAAIDAVQPIDSQTLLLIKAHSCDRPSNTLSAHGQHLLLAGDERHGGWPGVAVLCLHLGQGRGVEQGVHLGKGHQGLCGVIGTLLGLHGHERI